VFIHVLLREVVDADIATWYEAQGDKSQAIREALRLAIQIGQNGGQGAAVEDAVADVLQRYLPDLVSAAVGKALVGYRLAQVERGEDDADERARALATLKAGLDRLPLEED